MTRFIDRIGAFLRQLFKGRIDSPQALRIRDSVHFGPMPVASLDGLRLRVTEINTRQADHRRSPVFTLTHESGLRLFMHVQGDAETPLVVSQRVERSEVSRLFDLAQFARLFEDKDGPLTLDRREEPDTLAGWTVPRYHLVEDAGKEVHIPGDYRDSAFLPSPSAGLGLDRYRLTDPGGVLSVEVEVYDSGETEVFTSLRVGLDRIVEMRPG
ncbi:MAG: hypothetical protein HQL82_14555 [Magnetococcales bacterium]|nr:hypothetical protein [Magnetococcales bacterium]